jgi:hypothetical protein
VFAFLPDLEQARCKEPDAPWQRIVLAFGLALQGQSLTSASTAYLWEPAPGCLNVRPGEVGSFVTGGAPEQGPVTTIAWRMCHIGDFLRHERNWRLLGREPEQLDRDIRHPTTAVGGIRYVEESWSSWQRLVSSLTPVEMWERLGSIAGPYAEDERIGFVIHIMDELIHHSAEIGVMRDLYAAMARS